MLRLMIATLCALMLTPALAIAQARVLEPGDDWSLRAEDEYCRLSRSFGSGSRAVSLYFYSYGPVGSYQVILVGERLPRNSAKARVAQVAWGDIAEAEPTVVINGSVGQQGSLTFRTYGNRPSPRMAWIWSGESEHRTDLPLNPTAGRLSIGTNELEPIELQVGDLTGPLAQLAECEAGLLAGWGVAPGQFADLASLPELRNGYEVLRNQRWPAPLLLNRQSLFLQYRYTVTAEGRVEDCVVQSPALEERDQRLLCGDFARLARFTPATDANGAPVSTLFRNSTMVFVFD